MEINVEPKNTIKDAMEPLILCVNVVELVLSFPSDVESPPRSKTMVKIPTRCSAAPTDAGMDALELFLVVYLNCLVLILVYLLHDIFVTKFRGSTAILG